MRLPPILLAAVLLSACEVTTVSVPPGGATEPAATPAGTPQSARDFAAVVARVEPVAEAACRQQTRNANCDFLIVVDSDPRLQPNAYQTFDRNGRPVIGFTATLFREMRNRDELAFALAHEAAHHIAGHIPRIQSSATAGALLGGLAGALVGLDTDGIREAQRFGGTIGARRYSKGFELEADQLGARIAARAGYDPVRGVQYFLRAPDPGDRFLGTHPPNSDRIAVVRAAIGR